MSHGRAWQRMLSGRRLNLLDPSPLDIEIEDIAHGLSRVARWNGQTRGEWAFSVAQHCILVEHVHGSFGPSQFSARKWRLAALLHDAAEYVIGDLISPFKVAVGGAYKSLEHRLEWAIRCRFGLPPELPAELPPAIKKADRLAAYLEATQLAGFSEEEARRLFGPPPPTVPRLEPLPPDAARSAFLARFRALTED